MFRLVIFAILFFSVLVSARAVDQVSSLPGGKKRTTGLCVVEVLFSEELPGAPIFQNWVRATLRITPPDKPPFETTVSRHIPWQVPPPRRRQRQTMPCNASSLSSF
jgi:hypothetical protein